MAGKLPDYDGHLFCHRLHVLSVGRSDSRKMHALDFPILLGQDLEVKNCDWFILDKHDDSVHILPPSRYHLDCHSVLNAARPKQGKRGGGS